MSPLLLVALGFAVVLVGLLWLRLHAFLAMLLAAVVVAIATPTTTLQSLAQADLTSGKITAKQAEALAKTTAPERVVSAFGETAGKVGVLIALASVIGKCLLDSGAAMRVVQAMLGLFGQARVHVAFVFTGFTLSIPVYFDAVFYLLMPIGKAMARVTQKDYLLYILTIVAGATMAHSLVPPTPGPLFAAKALGVDMGTMIIGGCIVGLFTASFGLVYAIWANRRWRIELPEDAASASVVPPEQLPSLGLALLPILLPLGLITWGSFGHTSSLTDSNMALGVGTIAGLALLARHRRPGETVSGAVQEALLSGAAVVLITSAGGAFGAVLRQTGIAEVIQQSGAGSGSGFWALPVCFIITALVRIAQGSATVAMITVAPIAQAFTETGSLDFHPVYLALAIGCGSKPIPWMNDSGFWIITRMTGLKEAETLKIVSPMMSLMGLVGLPIVLLGAWLWPLI